jgi:hypothetical protein
MDLNDWIGMDYKDTRNPIFLICLFCSRLFFLYIGFKNVGFSFISRWTTKLTGHGVLSGSVIFFVIKVFVISLGTIIFRMPE